MPDGQYSNQEIRKRVDDFSTQSISFPTDKLSVSDLRTLSPVDFEWDFGGGNSFHERDSIAVLLDNALHYERLFAAFAFCKQKNLPVGKLIEGFAENDKSELIRLLHQSYEQIGLSNSLKMTTDIASEIEMQIQALSNKNKKAR